MDEEKCGSNTLQKKIMLNCWTSSSDISGYHADFHEGHSTVGAGQGHGMLCVNRPLHRRQRQLSNKGVKVRTTQQNGNTIKGQKEVYK